MLKVIIRFLVFAFIVMQIVARSNRSKEQETIATWKSIQHQIYETPVYKYSSVGDGLEDID